MQANVFRCGTHRYAQVAMSICYETELSGKALGYFTKIQSLPENFHFTAEGFSKLFRDGRDAVRSGLAELEGLGYLVRAQRRAEHGQYMNETLWITLDEPGLTGELRELLSRHRYEIVSSCVREVDGAEANLDLAAIDARLTAEEARRVDELIEESFTMYDPEARRALSRCRRRRERNESAEAAPAPASGCEPISEKPLPALSGHDAPVVENHGISCGNDSPAIGAALWKTEEPTRSAPESETPPSDTTGACDSTNPGNARSAPHAALPTSAKPTEYRSFTDPAFSPLIPKSTQPATKSTCQVSVAEVRAPAVLCARHARRQAPRVPGAEGDILERGA